MIPRYFHWECSDCQQEIKNSSCVCNGLYCGMHDWKNFNGFDIVMEDIRQKCIFQDAKYNAADRTWWDYMAVHRELCSDNLTESCSREVHRQVGLNFTTTSSCVSDSFYNNTDPKTAKDNKYL